MTASEWLNNNTLSIDIWKNKYCNNDETFEEWLDRVSNYNEEIKQLIKDKKFLFGGRTLANRGTNKGSYSNCYSIGYVPDSLEGIMDVNSKIAMTFKAQGGQGLSLSKIRPKGSLINGQFKSDGIVPFMEIFNTTTSSISQGGSRKGALMMSLDINHPEAETFMTIKKDLNKINKANLSVEIDDDFMNNLDKEENKKKYNILCETAWQCAEPGVIFTNMFRNYNIMEFVDDYSIETSNPCGEQPLAKHSSCNLSSINLGAYVKNPFTVKAYFDYKEFVKDIPVIVRAMDDIITENADNHALQEQKDMALKYRNIGIGIMGLADLFVKLNITYGSPDSIRVIENIGSMLLREAIYTSALLGSEKGNFPGYNPKVWDSTILRLAFTEEEIQTLKDNDCLRNCSLLSVAPTGSIATMLNVSTGVEPYFMLSFNRKTVSLQGEKEVNYKINIPTVDEYYKVTGSKELPNTFVTAYDINWKNRIDVQSALQTYIDTAISSTINLPKDITVEEIKKLYHYAWECKLKGVTIYRDGSREPILSKEATVSTSSILFNSIIPISRKKIGTTYGQTTCKKCACGTLYVTTNKDNNNNFVEVFTHTSKGGICQANLNAVTRGISLALRSGIKVDEIADQLKGIHCPACAMAKAKGQKIDGLSCPDIISKVMKEFTNKDSKVEEHTTKCPECGAELIHEGGCTSCQNCGFSRCG